LLGVFIKGLKLLILVAGEAYHSSEAKDVMTDHKSLFAVDGVTDRTDCDAAYDFENANKLNLILVSWFSDSTMYQRIASDYFKRNLPSVILYASIVYAILIPLSVHLLSITQTPVLCHCN